MNRLLTNAPSCPKRSDDAHCLDPETGTNFTVGRGSVAAGDGRFEGATGTYELTGELLLPLEAGLFRADLVVDFN